MDLFFFVLKIIASGLLVLLGLVPLKESSEYRFTKTAPLIEGSIYVICGVIGFFNAWIYIIGYAAVGLYKMKRNQG